MSRRSRRTRHEQGTVALLVAVLTLVLFGVAALGVDIASQVNHRQSLSDTVDAAAHAGAVALPDVDVALADATGFAQANDPDSAPDVALFCVVASVPDATAASGYSVNSAQIPGTCDPGPIAADTRCNASICAIPCPATPAHTCNTVQVADDKPVRFGFGPAVGIDNGSTGRLVSAACKGSCGGAVATPIDFAIVADRTGSMGGAIGALETAVTSLLEYLSPSLHHVALGTIGRTSASPPSDCLSQPSASKADGPWFPVGLSDDYDDTDVSPPSPVPNLNSGSDLANAADCLGVANSTTGTYLAAPMAAARQMLDGTCQPSHCAGPVGARPGVKKGIIFMTDGQPNESTDPGGGYPFNSNGAIACNNVVNEAAQAKAQDITVVTVAFRLEGVQCNSGGDLVTERLAEMASPKADGQPSLDDGGGIGPGCNTPEEVAGENGDLDFFFCTPTASQLEAIFQSAANQIAGGVRLIRLP